ncbi:hypothetical protein BV25DRAFT_1818913 [Artomyces pyxidatus]|uniref:Uncharacterized protein n=1 Tax=Artomyces pyxidatus TaxID=48021 RepID=A0ACB8TGP0_9AGAM|nr:hypothetical protein BV25DRAFT_1818913 [Artomyces pyxidatus]
MASSTPMWAANFPQPISTPPKISHEELEELMRTKTAGVDFVVVDVRRTDIEALIKGAINVPAQTFYQTLPTLLPILSRIPKVIFHCQSSLGRGPRCAGWYADALAPDAISQSLILEGGMKVWLEHWADDASMTISVPSVGATADYPPMALPVSVSEALKHNSGGGAPT